MNTTYRNEIADHGAGLIAYIGLVNDVGVEISGGSYARQSVSWTAASDGTVRPTADLTFSIPAGTTVGGWRGYSAATAGTDYGGEDLTNESYTNEGEYKLIAAQTGILHTSA